MITATRWSLVSGLVFVRHSVIVTLVGVGSARKRVRRVRRPTTIELEDAELACVAEKS